MAQHINPDKHKFNNTGDDNKDLSFGKDTFQITDNDDEDILKNDAANDAAQAKPLSVAELKEDEDDLDEAETSGVL